MRKDRRLSIHSDAGAAVEMIEKMQREVKGIEIRIDQEDGSDYSIAWQQATN
jgi:hypothetical protein